MVVMSVPSVNVVNVIRSQHMTQYNVHGPPCEDSRLGASDRWIKSQGPQQGPCGIEERVGTRDGVRLEQLC